MKKIIALAIILIVSIKLIADDKEPVAIDDFAETFAMKTIAIPALANDFGYENHPIRIFTVFGTPNGTFTFNDSIVFYTPKRHFEGTDSLRYRIVDLENNLMSQFAKIYIHVENKGIDMLGINQVKAKILACGVQFWDGNTGDGYEVPAGSGLHTLFSKSFWIGGMDENGELHVAGERYKQIGNDYFPGPVSDTMNYNQDFDAAWFRVWKLNKEEIEHHRNNWQQPGYEPIENISSWPGNGNILLGQAPKLAPYYDWNGDGKYNAADGDFPVIKGDQTIFLIYNDDRQHTESGGKKMGVEIHAIYYAYDQPEDSALSQAIFGDYTIINRSENFYSDVYSAFFLDFDLGHWWDDFVGCDTLLHSGFAYNGTPVDGNGEEGTYGDRPPAFSLTCLNYKMTGFIHFNNAWQSPMTDPYAPSEYYNYMKCMWRDSTLLTSGGNGYGGTFPVKFIFPGDPSNPAEWSEAAENATPGDRRGLVSSGPYSLAPNDSLHFTFALVFARDYEGDNISSVAMLKEHIQEIRDFYVESLNVEDTKPETISLKVFPNPFQGALVVETRLPYETITWTVYDLMGKAVADGRQFNELSFGINLKSLDKGIYFLSLKNGKSVVTKKVIKM
ncbi:MAG: T9SS type A sorting domain-containing protein [Bacteroidales bacterium]|nr:T9SS type A sorting domain-containing protein [Bacteroidales bacterium]